MAISLSAATNSALNREFKRQQKQLDKDLRLLEKVLEELPKAYRVKERKKVLRKASEPLIAAAQMKAPVYRGGKRRVATLGDGTKVAYYPGNLKLSIKRLRFSKSPSIWVGPKVTKRRKEGDTYGLSNRKVDAYYAHWQEFGTVNIPKRPFLRPAFDQTRNQMLKIISSGFADVLKKFARRNRVRTR